jgi:hypothetical protein
MRPVEAIPGWRGELKENEGGSEFNYNILQKLL